MKIVLLAVAVVAFVGLSEAQVCKSSADCAAGQCCYMQPEFMVVSKKRQLVLPQLHTPRDTGFCDTYRVLHEQCIVFETINGHCGCGPGLSCQWVPDPTVAGGSQSLLGRRKLPPHNEPGAYRCAPKL